jgi:hypothetical protein
MRHPILLAAVASLATLAVPSAAHALDWNFSFSFDNGDTASGTMTTDGTSAVAGQTYTITSISGTFKGQSITGLGTIPFGSAVNQFEWTGVAHLLRLLQVLHGPRLAGQQGLGRATPTLLALITLRCGKFFGNSSGNLTSYSISPVSSSPAAAPGPLPLLGAGAAFSMSRRLRRRISRADLSGVAGSLPSRG